MEGLLVEQTTGIPGLSLPNLLQFITVFFFSALRIGAFLITAPFFGATSVPLSVRIITGMVLAVAFIGQVDASIIIQADLADLLRMIFVELFIGICIGLIVSMLFASVSLAGEKIASSGGLGFAAQVDPTTGGQTPVISNLLTLFLIVIFLSIDGHLALIRALYHSYSIFPLGGNFPVQAASEYGAKTASHMFEIASVIMLPVVALLLLTNFAVGVITRSSPQLNLFSFAFPITMMVVFLALYASVTPLGYAMEELVEFSIDYIGKFFVEMRDG